MSCPNLDYNQLVQENKRLKEGDLTPEEFHNLCHNKEKTVTVDEFCRGCEEYQKKLFNCSPIEDARNKIKELELAVKLLEDAVRKQNDADHPLHKKIGELTAKLRRFEYNEQEAKKEPKTFSEQIEAVHPMNKDGVDVEYELALKLVGERHGKYELVDLVHWLLVVRKSLKDEILG